MVAARRSGLEGSRRERSRWAQLERVGIVRARRLRVLGLLGLLTVLVIVLLASLSLGSKPLAIATVYDAFFNYQGSVDDTIVRGLRVPRTLLGLCAGAALGLAGTLMQGVTRNPLADPSILGVNTGAAFAVVIGVHAFGSLNPLTNVWFAFGGAAAASVVVYGLGTRGPQGATPVKLALAGAASTALLGALTNAILLADSVTFAEYRFWAVGSLVGRAADLLPLLPFLVTGALLAVALGPSLNVLSLGDDAARSLGQRVGLTRAVAATAVVLLVGAAVAVAGPIGFVGLIVPHVARAITGPDYRWVLPFSVLLAPILLISADIIGRVVARPAEIEVSIVTAIIGTPFLVALVRQRNFTEL
jgi:iron complex transport system permease protein